MSNTFTTEDYKVMENYLDDSGYGTYEAWAKDSDYVEVREPVATPNGWTHVSEWIDEHGNTVDIQLQLWFAIEDLKPAAEDWF